jgi:hypothetical protein
MTILAQPELDALRAVAATRGLVIRIDSQARIKGQPFLTLREHHGASAMTLAVFNDCKACAAWLGGSTK